MSGERIDITFCMGPIYVPHMAAAIASIMHAAPGADIRFIVLTEAISDANKARVEAAAPGATFFWADVGPNDVPEYADREHFSRPILFRLALEKLAPADCHRVIYMDADLIVMGDVRDLWNVDLKGASIGAVVEAEIDVESFAKQWGLGASPQGYLNSGVILIDLDKVRAEQGFSKAIDFVTEHSADLKYADQDALNVVYWGKWTPLPPAWNVQRTMVIPSIARTLPPELRFDERRPAVVHYTGPEKPWVLGTYHPYAWLYWRFMQRTEFYSEVVKQSGIGMMDKFRLWLRWLRRWPAAGATA